MATITVLIPVGERRQATLSVPPLPADLRGLTVGFVDNTKHNFDLLVQEMGALLKERFGVKAVVHRRKANASTAAAPPSGLIGTTVFQNLAVSEMAALGATGLPLLVIQHPLGGEKPEAVSRRALQAVEQLASLLGST